MKYRLLALFAVLCLLAGCAVSETIGGNQPAPNEAVQSQAVPTVPEEGTLSVTFLSVGQGDSAVVRCGEETMIVDCGGSESGSLVYSYLSRNGIDYVDDMVLTHPHSDHISMAASVLVAAQVGTIYSSVTEYDSSVFEDVLTYADKQGLSLTVPQPGDSFQVGDALVEVLGPLEDYTEVNDLSIILRLTYGETVFLFMGDAEATAEADLLEAGYDLSADVLKVGHHGSSTSTSQAFLDAVSPAYGVISCGEGNSYGHPHEEIVDRLTGAGVTILRTDLLGDITITSDGTDLTVTSIANPPAGTVTQVSPETEPEDQVEEYYIGNVNSQKFHRPTCPNLPKEENQTTFATREEAVEAGYTPCGNCNP